MDDTGFAPWRVRPHRVLPHYRLSTSSSQSFLATDSLISLWIKERGIISICDSIWLGANLIKLNRRGDELGGGKLAMGQNRQLPYGSIAHSASPHWLGVFSVWVYMHCGASSYHLRSKPTLFSEYTCKQMHDATIQVLLAN